jgi:hypothetical protein
MSGRRASGGVLLTALMLVVAVSAVAEPVLRWVQPPGKLLVGEPVELSIMLDDTLAVRTFEIEIRLDATVVEAIAGEAGALFDGLGLYTDFQTPDAETWYAFAVVLGAEDWAVGPGELFRWTIIPTTEGGTALETADLGLRPPGGGDYPDVELPLTVLDIGDVTASPPVAAPVAQLRAFPNPFNPRTILEIDAATDGPASLDVVDLRGRVVAELWRGTLPVGRWQLPWDARVNGGPALASGSYLVRLMGADGLLATQQITLLR